MIGSILDFGSTIIDKIWPDAGEKEKAKMRLAELAAKGELAELEGGLKVMLAEMNGNWLQRSWRPILMLVCIFIVFNNYVLFPYLKLFVPDAAVELQLDQNIWDLMKIGIGGYTACRTIDKGIKEWRKNS